MEQTKRRNKKGVILLALAVAVLVLAVLPASALAAPYQLRSFADWGTPAAPGPHNNSGVWAQGNTPDGDPYFWFGGSHVPVDGLVKLQLLDPPNPVPINSYFGSTNVHSVVWRIDGVPSTGVDVVQPVGGWGSWSFWPPVLGAPFGGWKPQYINFSATTGLPTEGIHTLSSWPVETVPGNPPPGWVGPWSAPETPLTSQVFGMDYTSPEIQHVQIISPSGYPDAIYPGTGYHAGELFWNKDTLQTDFTAFASDQEGSGVAPSPTVWVPGDVSPAFNTYAATALPWDRWTYVFQGTDKWIQVQWRTKVLVGGVWQWEASWHQRQFRPTDPVDVNGFFAPVDSLPIYPAGPGFDILVRPADLDFTTPGITFQGRLSLTDPTSNEGKVNGVPWVHTLNQGGPTVSVTLDDHPDQTIEISFMLMDTNIPHVHKPFLPPPAGLAAVFPGYPYGPASKTMTFTATDMVGFVTPEPYHVNWDQYAPHTTYTIDPIGADTQLGWTNKKCTVSFQAIDDGTVTPNSGVAKTEFVIVKGTTPLVPPNKPAEAKVWPTNPCVIDTTSPFGPNYVYYRSVDKAIPTGNEEDWHLMMVFYDGVAPALSCDYPGLPVAPVAPVKSDVVDDYPGWWMNQPFTVELTASDHNSGLAPPGIQWMVSPVFPGLGHGWQNSNEAHVHVMFGALLDGIFQLDYKATDKAGNSSSKTVMLKIDTRPPATDDAPGWAGLAPAAVRWVNGLKPYYLTAVDQTPGSGVAATIWRIDQKTPWNIHLAIPAAVEPSMDTEITGLGTVQGSIHTIDFGSVDNARPPDWTAADGVYLGNWELNKPGLWDGLTVLYWFIPQPPTQQGLPGGFGYILNIGNWTAYKSRTIRLDVTAPVSQVIPDSADWNRNPVELAFSASDVGSGVDFIQYSLKEPPTESDWTTGNSVQINREGSTVVSYRAVDKVGIVEATKTTTVKIDTVAPVTMVTGGSDGWSGNDVTLTFSATDATSGVATTEYNTGAGWVTGTSATISAEGVTTVMYRSTDVAGNVEAYKVTTVKIDKQAPVTTVAGNDDLWHDAPVTLAFGVTPTASGVANTEWSTNGTDWTHGSVAIISGNGEITVSYRSVSNAGVVEATKTVTVKVCTVAPVVTAGNTTVKKGGIATFMFNIDSVTPTALVTITLKNAKGFTVQTQQWNDVATGDNSKAFRVNLKAGKYKIVVRAVDAAGNIQSKKGMATLTVTK